MKEAVAAEFVKPVREWAELHGAVPNQNATDKDYLVAVALALIESPDAYQAGRYFEDFFDWPVTGDLIRILDQAYARMKVVVRRFVLEWVLENNVRFPAKKGEGIRFRIGDLELSGVIIEVLGHEAKGVVKLSNKGKHWAVNAEDVLEVTSPAEAKGKKT